MPKISVSSHGDVNTNNDTSWICARKNLNNFLLLLQQICTKILISPMEDLSQWELWTTRRELRNVYLESNQIKQMKKVKIKERMNDGSTFF